MRDKKDIQAKPLSFHAMSHPKHCPEKEWKHVRLWTSDMWNEIEMLRSFYAHKIRMYIDIYVQTHLCVCRIGKLRRPLKQDSSCFLPWNLFFGILTCSFFLPFGAIVTSCSLTAIDFFGLHSFLIGSNLNSKFQSSHCAIIPMNLFEFSDLSFQPSTLSATLHWSQSIATMNCPLHCNLAIGSSTGPYRLWING